MPISRTDYESTATNPVGLDGGKAGAPALAETTTAAQDLSLAFQPWSSSATAAAAALAELVNQTKELQQRMTRRASPPGEMAGAPSLPHARTNDDAGADAGQAKENVHSPDRVLPAEKAAAKTGVELDSPPANAAGNAALKLDDEPAEGGPMEQPPAGPPLIVRPSQAPPEEQTENTAGPEWPGAGRDLQNRFDAAQGRIGNPGQRAEELQALLDQAIALLEAVSQHPALRDYSASKRQLDEIEQRLGYGAYPQ